MMFYRLLTWGKGHPISVLLLVLFVVVACAISYGYAFPAKATPESQSSTAQGFTVGTPAPLETWTITVNSATTSAGSQYNQPQHSGDVFLVFNVSAKNISDQEQRLFGTVQFTLLDSRGQKYDFAADPDAGAILDGKVEPGQTLRAALSYEVPASQTQFTLEFQASLTQPGQTLWSITV